MMKNLNKEKKKLQGLDDIFVSGDDIVEGRAVNIINEDGYSIDKLEDGEYATEDGLTFIIEDGTVSNVIEKLTPKTKKTKSKRKKSKKKTESKKSQKEKNKPKKSQKEKAEESLRNRISKFVESTKGKSTLKRDEMKVLTDLYFELTGIRERNLGCDVCAIRMFKRINKYLTD